MDLSVFILTKDRYEKLVEAIRSIQCQSIQPQEIIIVDNGSIDGTPENILTEFPNDNIKLIKLHKNFGIVVGRNIGIKNCTGDIIFFFDDDAELIDKYTFKKVIYLFQERKEIGVITLNILDLSNKLKYNIKEKIIETPSFSGGVSFIRRNLFDEIGVFDDQFYNYAEENDFSIRLLASGYKIIALPNVKILHKVTQKRFTNRIKYYSFRNKLIILLRYFPAKYIIFEFLWIFFSNLIDSIKNRWFFLFIKSFYEIIFRINIDRKVISSQYIVKYLQLKKLSSQYNKNYGFLNTLKNNAINKLLRMYKKR
jgi:GT2 family glycosyltransferase